jgi:putative CocE/NonD family hydrolase
MKPLTGNRILTIAGSLALVTLVGGCSVQPNTQDDATRHIRDNYTKREFRIPMRDGATLFTAVYSPQDESESYPIMMRRTPYCVCPYGEDDYPTQLGPSELLAREKFIFVLQDVRGRFMSEGEFLNMTPHVMEKNSNEDVDESTDTYDTIEWLLENVPNNNGKVGMWGISYPGFYAAASMIDAHPALAAVSPQAPIADWWFDDFHHHGAFFLPHTFGFFWVFGLPRDGLTTEWPRDRFDFGTPDGYEFYLELGPIKNINERYYRGEIPFWNATIEHPNYDQFWQDRNIVPHLNDVAPAVMTVGGWFDAEDLYGPLAIYRSVEEKNPGVQNSIVMGPWRHGGWARDDGDSLSYVRFGSKTSLYYRESIELPFFNYYLKGKGDPDPVEAHMFETGANQWRTFEQWPPAEAEQRHLYMRAGGDLSNAAPSARTAWDEYVSDPANPVPYIGDVGQGMIREYMIDDQRFASRRPDVLVYQTEVLEEDVTLAGPVIADLWVSTSGTDSDWVVKLVDVFPPDTPNRDGAPRGVQMGGYQMMVRSEVIRGRFRDSYEFPEPFVPNQATHVVLPLQDVLHTFKRGHRIMVHVQSTWFPLVDRNPQTYVDNIYTDAEESDFIAATQRVYRSRQYPSHLRVGVLPR